MITPYFNEDKFSSRSKYSWWSGNGHFISFSGKYLGAHIIHAGLITLWAGAMSLFESAHYVSEKSIYEQGFILIPHMAALSFGVGPGGEIYSIYPFFIIGVMHIIVSGILGLGGIYHFIFGSQRVRRNNLRHTFYFFVAESIQGINSFRSAFNYFRFNINFITYKKSILRRTL